MQNLMTSKGEISLQEDKTFKCLIYVSSFDKLTNIVTLKQSYPETTPTVFFNFHQIGPLGRFGLVVEMSVYMCPSHAILPGEQRRSQGTKAVSHLTSLQLAVSPHSPTPPPPPPSPPPPPPPLKFVLLNIKICYVIYMNEMWF